MSQLRHLLAEIHRRSLWQVLGIYALTSWAIYQVVLALYDGIGLPHWVPGTALVLLLIGLPIVLATAFVQEGGPLLRADDRRTTIEGLERPSDLLAHHDHRSGSGGAGAGADPEPPAARRTPAGAPARSGLFTWPKAITGGVLAFALLGLAATGFLGMRALGVGPAATLVSSGLLRARDPVVLADFAPLSGDESLSRVVTEAFRADLAQSDVIKLANPADVAEVLGRMGRDAAASLDAAVAREVATRGGMKAVIAGEVGEFGGRYVLTARVIGALDGEVLLTLRETATDSTDVIPAIDRLSKSTRERIGESLRSVRRSPFLIAITTPSLPALKKLVQAYDASNRGDNERALVLLDEAIALDPSFAEAHRKRGAVLNNLGRNSEALDAFEQALAHPERLTDYERYHTRGIAAVVTGNTREALAAYTALLEINPHDSRALNNLGVTYVRTRDFRRAEEAFTRALAIVDSFPAGQSAYASTYTNLAGTRWNLGYPDSARAALSKLEELDPDHPGIDSYRGIFASAAGDYAAAASFAQAVLDAQPASPQWQQLERRRLAELEAVQGRIGRAVHHYEEAIRISTAHGTARDALLTASRRALVETLVLADTTAAMRTLARIRAQHDIDSATDAPLVLLTAAYATAGQLDSARSILARVDALPRWAHGWLPIMLPAAQAAVAAAAGDHARAAALWSRAAETPYTCPICFLPQLGTALERQGADDAAIEAYRRYLETPFSNRAASIETPDGDALWRAFVHERLAWLYERRGDARQAIEHHRALIELWRDADTELQPRVQAARRALARLSAEGDGTP